MKSKLWSLLFVLILTIPVIGGQPGYTNRRSLSALPRMVSYGIPQAGCAAAVVACYSAAGFVFGTVTAGAGTPPAILACNAAFAKCSAAFAAMALLAPTP